MSSRLTKASATHVRKGHVLAGAAAVTILGLAGFAATALGLGDFRAFAVGSLALGALIAALGRWRLRSRGGPNEGNALVAKARLELDRGDYSAAAREAAKACELADSERTRNGAYTVLAWASLAAGRPESARAALHCVRPGHQIDLHCLAAVEAAMGRARFAIQALEVARTFGTLTREGAMLLVDCYLRECGIRRAVVAALQNRRTLGDANCQEVVAAARREGADEAADMLARALREPAP